MKALGLAVVVLVIATTSAHGEIRRIRVCADPSNLPFSSQRTDEPGFELEIARAIAGVLGAELSVHWFPTVREVLTLRQLYDGQCDLLMGVPLTERFTADKPRLTFTVPYYAMRQVIVAPALGRILALDDLRGRLVGVQAMTLSDQLVYERGYNRKVYLNPGELFTALLDSQVDAAVMESVFAGWFARKNAGFHVAAIGDRQRDFEIGAAVRKTDTALKDALDRAIRELRSTELPAITSRYGLDLAQTGPAAAPLTAELRSARSTYMTQCSQCHGIDAKGSPAAASLQGFKGTEDDFLRVVQKGRPGTAMTPWKGLISDEEIRNIARFVKQLTTSSQP